MPNFPKDLCVELLIEFQGIRRTKGLADEQWVFNVNLRLVWY